MISSDLYEGLSTFPMSVQSIYWGSIESSIQPIKRNGRWTAGTIKRPVYITRRIVPTDWKELPNVHESKAGDCIGIRAGKDAGITVVRLGHGNRYDIPLRGQRMFAHGTGDAQVIYVIYRYDPAIPNISAIPDLPGISIINDGFFWLNDQSTEYFCEDNTRLTVKMPSVLRKMVLGGFNAMMRAGIPNIDMHIHNMLMSIPDKWINRIDLFRDITIMVRNEVADHAERVRILQTVMEKKAIAFDVFELKAILSIHMDYRQKRCTHQSILNKINKLTEGEATTGTMCPVAFIVYEQDSLVSIASVKSRYRDLSGQHIDISNKCILGMDPRFKIVRMRTCKSCKALHHKNCCDEYSRTNQSTAMFVKHARL